MSAFRRRRILPVLAVCSALLSAACTPESRVPERDVSAMTIQTYTDALHGKRILFAHQSVGGNIIDGIHDLAGDRLPVVRLRDAGPGPAGLRHYYVGENGDPDGKIADFVGLFSATQSPDVDVAILKFCFLDFTPQTDAVALAGRYLAALADLRRKYPRTRFVAVTAPLTVVRMNSPRSWLQRLLGRAPAGFEVNRKRAEFSALVRAQTPVGELFDLAALEASSADGASSVTWHGTTVSILNPALSDDGGHLNATGRSVAAAGLLRVLAGGSGLPGR